MFSGIVLFSYSILGAVTSYKGKYLVGDEIIHHLQVKTDMIADLINHEIDSFLNH